MPIESERSALLNQINSVKKNVILFSVTYSPTLLNVRDIVDKDLHILNINNTFGIVFKATPVIAFRKNKSLGQVVGTNIVRQNQRLKKWD